MRLRICCFGSLSQGLDRLFRGCQTPSVLQSLEEWTRLRFRSAIWKQWKRGSVRPAELRKRGVGKDLAAAEGFCFNPRHAAATR